jgi:hypothetical protein
VTSTNRKIYTVIAALALLALLLFVDCADTVTGPCTAVAPVPLTIVINPVVHQITSSHPCIDLTVNDHEGNLLEFIAATEPCGCI